MTSRYIRAFVFSAAVIFALTATAKLASAMGDARILNVEDPMLSLKTRHVLAVVGALEALVAAYLFFGGNLWGKLALTVWMAMNFLIYRLGLWWTDGPRPCACLGTVTDALPVSPRFVDYSMKAILAYLLIGSVALLLANLRNRDPQSEAPSSPAEDAGAGA